MPISLLWHDVNLLIYKGGFLTTTFDLDVDGTKELVIPRDYQLDPIKDKPLHVDFLRIRKGSKIDVDIPVHAINEDEAPGLKKGGVVNIVRHSIELKVPADAIPDAIEIDIAGMEIGDVRHMSDIKLPRGSKFTTPGSDHGMYKISRALNRDKERRAGIVPVESFERSCHLIPDFGPVAPRNWTSSNVLDECKYFFVNPFVDRNTYKLLY